MCGFIDKWLAHFVVAAGYAGYAVPFKNDHFISRHPFQIREDF